MAGRKKDPKRTTATRNDLLEKSYELFTKKNIETVSMIEIAKECGYGTTTLYRYYSTKPKLVVAAAARKWEQFESEIWERRDRMEKDREMTSAEEFEYYLDSFLELYREHRDLLRFNQFFNIYIQSEKIESDAMGPYQELLSRSKREFHSIYAKALADHGIRTDISEGEMFSTTLHLMLAAVTRYAVGLAYRPEGFDDMKELTAQKEMLLARYTKDRLSTHFNIGGARL